MIRSITLACSYAAALVASHTAARSQSPAPGLRLYGPVGQLETRLVDTAEQIVHTWTSAFVPGVSLYLDSDGTLLRTALITTPLGVGGDGGGLQRLALDGTVLWDFRYSGPSYLSHHDIAILPNGNVLMVAWDVKSLAEATAAGRNPAQVAGQEFRPDHLIEVRPTGPTTGDIVWEWHVWDHLVQDFDPAQANFDVVADHPELVDVNYPIDTPVAGDWNHMNSVAYDPVHDWIIVSVRAQNEIWVIDHSTTTAEAASHAGGRSGKGGDLLYRWGNPEAYRAGGPTDQQLFGQHGANFIPPGYRGAGNILLFNNLANAPESAVWELVPPIDPAGRFVRDANQRYGPSGPIWTYADPTLRSSFVSNCERLPNGHTLICSGAQGWIIEVTPGGQTVWQHLNPATIIFHAHYVERSLWSDRTTLSIGAGGTATFELIAGSPFAGHTYLMLGSVSGTSPGFVADHLLVPLNVDSYTLTTISLANTFPLGTSTGSLDARGRATATFTLPGGVLPPAAIGLQFDHAIVALNPMGGQLSFVSNPVPLVLELP